MPNPTLSKQTNHPTILHPAPLPTFLHHILTTTSTTPPQQQTHLLICSTRQSFTTHLLHSLHPQPDSLPNATTHQPATAAPLHNLFPRTLSLLAASRSIRLAFIPSVPALHAYLSTLPQPPTRSATHESTDATPFPGPPTPAPAAAPAAAEARPTPTLAVLGLVELHRGTPAFSGQGLGRAFAGVVEAGWRGGWRVVFVEGWGGVEAVGDGEWEGDVEMGIVREGGGEVGGDVEMGGSGGQGFAGEGGDGGGDGVMGRPGEEGGGGSVWEEEVPVLNASTKTFGGFGEGGWIGRKVRIGDVARRWCRFETLPAREVL